jgi:hypothetical protein
LGKIRDFLKIPVGHEMVRLASVPEKPRGIGDGAIEGSVSFVSAGSLGKNEVPSFVEVLRRGARRPEVEKKLSWPVDPLGESHRDRSEEEKLLWPVKPLGKDLCDRCGAENVKGGMGVSQLSQSSAARGKSGYFFGDSSADIQLTGEEHTYPSLLLWKSQLEKL